MRKRAIIGLFSIAGITAVTIIILMSLSRAKQRAESLNCASSICSICLGARLWAEDNEGRLPPDFVGMSNEINTTKILVCAADHERQPAADWASLGADNSSYELLSPGLPASNTNTAILRCKVHGQFGYADGTVFDGIRRRGKYD